MQLELRLEERCGFLCEEYEFGKSDEIQVVTS